MTKEKINLCEEMIKKWNSLPSCEEKNIVRNKLFLIMQKFMEKWVSAHLSRQGKFFSSEEIKSISWDCFTYCLRLFKPERGIPIPNHFYSYTRFFLLPSYFDKKEIELNAKVKSSIEGVEKNPFLMFELTDELRFFRKCLPPEYLSVFDDCIINLSPNKSKTHGHKKSPPDYCKYQEAKKIFRIVIDFLIMK